MNSKAHQAPWLAGIVLTLFVSAGSLSVRAEIIKGPYLQNVTTSEITIMWESERA